MNRSLAACRLPNWSTLRLTAMAIAGVGLAATLHAQTAITVVNHSFETTGGILYNEFSFGALPGWSLYDPDDVAVDGHGPIYYIGTLAPHYDEDPGEYRNFPAGAADGSRVAIAFAFVDSQADDRRIYGLEQTLSATLQANTTYRLEVEIGNIASGVAEDTTSYDLSGFPGYRVELLAGGEVIAMDDNTLTGIGEGLFETSTVMFSVGGSHALLGQPLGIRLINLNILSGIGPNADSEVDFDNVRLTAVPEPATAALLLGFTTAAVCLGRRRLFFRS